MPRPASKEGKLELTKALRSYDRSRGNSRRLPVWSATDEVLREVRERRAADHLLKLEGLGQGAVLARVGWKELETGDVQHNMGTGWNLGHKTGQVIQRNVVLSGTGCSRFDIPAC